MDALIDLFADAQQALFEGLLQPLMFTFGLGNLLADGYQATGWLLVGLIEIGLMVSVLRALERWRPVEVVTDRAACPCLPSHAPGRRRGAAGGTAG